MNTNPGLLATKLGNTQLFLEDGEVRRVTALQAGPCVIVGKRTEERDGYVALVLGFGEKKAKHVNRAQSVAFEKAGVTTAPQHIAEFRVSSEIAERFNLGDKVGAADIFVEGQLVDVTGDSKGRGFQGVIKRHNFRGTGSLTHGAHEYMRHGGSIGQNMTPGRTFRGMRMPGQMGNKRTTAMNLKVTRVLDGENIVLVEGSVPGGRNGIVTIKGSSRRPPVALPERAVPAAAESTEA